LFIVGLKRKHLRCGPSSSSVEPVALVLYHYPFKHFIMLMLRCKKFLTSCSLRPSPAQDESELIPAVQELMQEKEQAREETTPSATSKNRPLTAASLGSGSSGRSGGKTKKSLV
jgi:hypothetical protein